MKDYEGNFTHCSEKEATLNILGVFFFLEWTLLEFIPVRISPLVTSELDNILVYICDTKIGDQNKHYKYITLPGSYKRVNIF